MAQEDILSLDETQIKWTDKEVFTGFVTRPKKTFDYVIEQYYNKYVVFILVCYGVIRALEKGYLEKNLPLGQLLFNVIMGGLFGWLGVYLIAFIYVLISRAFKGVADIRQLARVIAYSFMVSLLFSVVKLIIAVCLRLTGFQFSIDFTSSLPGTILLMFSSLLSLAVALYTLTLMVLGFEKANDYSRTKAILTVSLPIIFILLIFILIFAFNGFGDFSWSTT